VAAAFTSIFGIILLQVGITESFGPKPIVKPVKPIWEHEWPAEDGLTYTSAVTVSADGLYVYVGAGVAGKSTALSAGGLIKLDALTGFPLWTLTPNKFAPSEVNIIVPPTVSQDGSIVYYVSEDNTVCGYTTYLVNCTVSGGSRGKRKASSQGLQGSGYCLNDLFCSFLPTSNMTEEFLSPPTLSYDGTVLLCPVSHGEVYALNAFTGKLLWSYETASIVAATVGVDRFGSLYVMSFEGVLHAVSLHGDMIWKSSVGGLSAQSAPFVSTDGLKVYGGTYAKIFCIDAKAGTMLWSVTQSTIGTMGDGVASLDESMLFFGAEDAESTTGGGLIFAVDGTDGALIWGPIKTPAVVHVKPAVHSTIAGKEDFVIFTSNSGDIYCADFKTGEMFWNYSTSDRIATRPQESDSSSMLYVAAGPNILAFQV